MKGWLLIVLVAALGLALFVGVFILRARQNTSFDRRVCKEIEGMKQLVREEAWEQFNKYPQTLKLLHIPKTPAIHEEAKANRDSKLHRYAKRPCNV